MLVGGSAPPRRAEVLDFRDKVLAAIKNKLTESGIDLPFPTQQILFHDQTEETDGDRLLHTEGWPAGNVKTPKSHTISSYLQKIAQMKQTADNNHYGM